METGQENKNALLTCSGNGCKSLRLRVKQKWQQAPPKNLIVTVRNLNVEDIKFTIFWNGILGGGISQKFTIFGNSEEQYTASNGLVGATITSAKIIDTRP